MKSFAARARRRRMGVSSFGGAIFAVGADWQQVTIAEWRRESSPSQSSFSFSPITPAGIEEGFGVVHATGGFGRVEVPEPPIRLRMERAAAARKLQALPVGRDRD